MNTAKVLGIDERDAIFIAEQLLGEAMESEAGTPRFVVSDATVLDTSTGLTWQREVPDKCFTRQEAKNYAASLNLDGGGWRLPTKDELLSIVDETRSNPCIDIAVFPDTPSECFWSSSPYAGYPACAWHVYFGDGYEGFLGIGNTFRVRCVR